MEPTTMISIAKFGIGLFSNSGPDPLDAIVKMINSLNKKLNVIEDKLDLILEHNYEIPLKVNYQREITTLKEVLNRVDDNIAKYNEDIKNNPRRGRRNWLSNNTVQYEVMDNLLVIRRTVEFLKQFHDPITVNLMSLCVFVENEYANLTNEQGNHMVIENKKYLQYYKRMLLDEKNSIEASLKQKTALLEYYLNNVQYVKAVYYIYNQREKEADSSRGSGSRYTYSYEDKHDKYITVYYKWTPVIEEDIENEEVNMIIDVLYQKAYYNYKTKFKHIRYSHKKITKKEFLDNSLPSNTSIKKINKYIPYEWRSKPRYKTIKGFSTFKPNSFSKGLEKSYNDFILIAMAHQNVINSMHYVNNKILSYGRI